MKYQYQIKFRASDHNNPLDGTESYTDIMTLMNQIDSWATNVTPLTMRHVFELFDNKTVIIDPASVQPVKLITSDDREIHLGQATVLEV